MGPFMNHLEYEKSPYLLQHRENPVDWYPWGEEAFQKAGKEDKPVFLSIGYSTCHWCHVMAHESFEDDEVARLLNRFFVPVKVDREERPDIDAVYMSACQAMTGSGGWPLTLLLTPDKKPFFAGTYLPKASRYGMPGLVELLEQTAELWESDRESMCQTGERILAAMNQNRERKRGQKDKKDQEKDFVALVEQGVRELKGRYDERFGGFGTAPKFPAAHNLLFLMRYGLTNKDARCLEMADNTLRQMARGGIYDQIGGGFCRYSTDERWLVPHFEKMLYDNAWLAEVYLEAGVILRDSFYTKTARRTLDYVKRELTAPEGGFYCGQDADSEGREGEYYVFSLNEIEEVLGEGAQEFCRWFGITETGNFEGKNIPNLLENRDFTHTPETVKGSVSKLYDYRKSRTVLHRDDKILTSWNSMMITAYARAGFWLGDREYTKMAQRAEQFIANYLINEEDRIMVRYREGECAFLGNLEDYAYYCRALLSLYDSTFQIGYLEKAVHRAGQMMQLFWDEEEYGFYFYGRDDEKLISRPKEVYDGAVPSGNSVAAHVLNRLFQLTGEDRWRGCRDLQMDFLASEAEVLPSGHSFSLLAFEEMMRPGTELVCVSENEEVPEELSAFMKRQHQRQIAVLFKCPGNERKLSEAAPFTKGYPIPESGQRYYLCKNRSCLAPFSDIKMLEQGLEEAEWRMG